MYIALAELFLVQALQAGEALQRLWLDLPGGQLPSSLQPYLGPYLASKVTSQATAPSDGQFPLLSIVVCYI